MCRNGTEGRTPRKHFAHEFFFEHDGQPQKKHVHMARDCLHMKYMHLRHGVLMHAYTVE